MRMSFVRMPGSPKRRLPKVEAVIALETGFKTKHDAFRKASMDHLVLRCTIFDKCPNDTTVIINPAEWA